MKQVGGGNAALRSSSTDEESDSCSAQSSSDATKECNVPQFSVLRSDSDGLRMKISAIRSNQESTNQIQNKGISNNNNVKSNKNSQHFLASKKRRKRKESSGTSSSYCSVCSRSESECSSNGLIKTRKARVKRRKVNMGTSEKKSEGISTDSEPEENLAEKNVLSGSMLKGEPISTKRTALQCDVLPGGCISSSDNDIPALVSAAIKCVESCSESENQPFKPSKQYTSTLLQDYMAKTQMLGSSSSINKEEKSENNSKKILPCDDVSSNSTQNNSAQVKKKRGRPKKNIVPNIPKGVILDSADSGITSTAQSSSPSPNSHNNKKNKIISEEPTKETIQKSAPIQKLNLLSLDKQMYATERILYPPKGKKKINSKPTGRTSKNKEDILDPLWKKIDVNSKFRRPSLTGYKSDGGTTICSKVLAARSGYVSDYGSVGYRPYSGYKSDASGKSRYSMRSYVSRAKSCDYRGGYTSGKSRKFRRKKQAIKSSKSLGNVNDQDILQLAGLSLGQSSEESSRESVCKPILTNSQSKKYGEINRFVRTGEYFGRNKKVSATNDSVVSEKNEASSNSNGAATSNLFSSFPQSCISSYEFQNFSKKIRLRRSSAVSRCSSFSTVSRCDVRKKRRHRPRLKSVRNYHIDSKLNTEVEILINSFSSLRLVNLDKSNSVKEKDKNDREKSCVQKTQSKRNLKKRKFSDNSEHHLINPILKRRHKRTSPDEHKLPLKKRHYLLTPGEKSEGKNLHNLEVKSKDSTLENKPISGKNCTNANSKIVSKAITPKKRHLLETSKNNSSDENEQGNNNRGASSSTSESKSFTKSVESRQEGPLPKAGQPKSEKDIVKKKNRLEGLVTKIQTANTTSSLKDGVLTNPESTGNFPPPGIFEPSDELEIQIPVSELATSIVTKAEVDSPKVVDYTELNKSLTEPKFERVVETLLNKTGGNLILKRKRRKTNRTGFPSVKKKKRKTTIDEVIPGDDLKCKEDIAEESVGIKSISNTNTSEKLCDRVPRMGEASDSFLERHRKPRLSVVSLEKLQDPVKRLDKIDSVEIEVKAPKKAAVSNNKNEQIIEKSSVAKTKLNSNAAKVLIRKKPGVRRRRGRKPWYNRNVKISKYKIAQAKVVENQEIKDNSKSRSTSIPEAAITDKQKINKVENINSDSNKVNTTQKKEKVCGENISPEDLEQEPLPANEGPNESNEICSLEDKSVKNKKHARWRKTYLSAGLLSDYYKSDIKTRKLTSERLNKQAGPFSDDSTSGLLPPPPYCEKFYRKTVNDFMLPYDVWWAYKNSKLPSRVTVPSWNYKRIRTNVYGDVRPTPAIDHQACNCKPLAACGDDCLNRMVYTECSPSNCPCGEKCENQKIQKHDIAPGIERFMTENKGWGVKTSLPIKKGTYILEYVGEVVTEKEFKERMATLYVNDIHHYCLNLDGGLVIDGHRMGSDGRFVNHSCSPNCEMQKWSVNGLFRMALFASRNIQAGEELTYDYNFSLFNPSEGQPCRCNTPQCRGVIGGKSQRVKPLEQKPTESQPQSGVNKFGRARKRQAKKITGRFQSKDIVVSLFQQPTDREKKIARGQHCFLIRNLEKVRKLKMKLLRKDVGVLSRPLTPVTLAVQITALRVPRNIKTRGLTQAAHDPEVEKIAKMAVILRDICISLENIKDNEDKSQLAKLLPAFKRKRPAHDRGSKIVDFPTIQANIERGFYKDPSVFDEDVNKVFTNALAHFGEHSREAAIVIELSHAYKEKKFEAYEKLSQIVPDKELTSFRPLRTKKATINSKSIEDIIQCICGLFKDEGLMIQCSKCLVWQHAECTKANTKADNYLCERCEPRIVDLEIPLDEYTEEGYRYYLSLLRGDLQIRQGDTVYVLRDIPIKDENGKVYETKKHTYETIGKIDYSECDIFRVERLWKNDEGKRFIFGHHYLRPHETFHEPSRKFYENEVIRVPLYEVVPIELVIARCWVLDRSTFCKGRPVDVTSEEHVYICELRVDKSARFFARAKQSYPTCTKNYAFRKFSEKIRISRTYTPHEVDPSLVKPKKRKTDEVPSQSRKILPPVLQLLPPPPKTVHEKRNRLENILGTLRKKQALLNSIPLDLSYLLTGRGARQRRAHAVNVPI